MATKRAPQKTTIKPAAKPAPKKAAARVAPKPSPKAPPKAIAKPVAQPTVWSREAGHEHHHHHPEGACCGHSHKSMLSCLCTACPIAKMLVTRSFWAAAVVAFIVIFATDWLLHTRYLLADYAATSALWRADGEIRHGLIFITQAVLAMAYAAIIIGMGHAKHWLGSFSSGAVAAMPVAMCAMSTYVMMPFADPYIPTVWGVAAVLQGALAGLAICAALKASRAPDVESDCCQPRTLH